MAEALRNLIVPLKDGGGKLVVKPRVELGITIRAAADGGAGKIVALVSTEAVDSYGDIIRQGKNEHGKGWILDRFNRHPVMLWSHDIRQPSLGGGRAYVDAHPKHGPALFFEPDFDQEDGFATMIEGKIRRGILNESSVGFVSKADGPREDAPSGYDFFESELLELSWCNRGANPDTEVMMKSLFSRHGGLGLAVDPAGIAGAEDAVVMLQAELAELRAELDDVQRQLRRLRLDDADARRQLRTADAEAKIAGDLARMNERLAAAIAQADRH